MCFIVQDSRYLSALFKAWLSSLIIIFSMFGFVIYLFMPYFKLLGRSIVKALQWLLRLNRYSAYIELASIGDKRKDDVLFVILERYVMRGLSYL